VINLVGNVPDDFIPTNFSVMYDTYSPFVTRLVTRYNRVQANFEDLLQHVWMKLVEVDVIQKYNDSSSLPKFMDGLSAAYHVGKSWSSYKRTIHRQVVGEDRYLDRVRSTSKSTKVKLLRRDHGICHCCGQNMIAFARSFEMYKKDPGRKKFFKERVLRDLQLTSKQKTFWYAEKTDTLIRRGMNDADRYKTVCFICLRQRRPPVVRSKSGSGVVPTPVKGTWASKKAIYRGEDVERFRLYLVSKGLYKNDTICPKKFKSKPFFKLYLARAVHNIYANWCRTRARRYKEHFPGTDPETGRSWEDTLVSSSSTQDVLSELHEAVNILIDNSADTVTRTHEEVIILLAKGCSPEEIVARLGLPKRGLKTLSLGV